MNTQVKLAHVAVPAQNPRQLAAFYQDFLGLTVTLEGTLPPMGAFIFLSDEPAEQAQTLALISQPRARHIAWQVATKADLQAVYAHARASGVAIDRALDHRVTWSLYLHDPEGNGVEVFWATGQPAEGMHAAPLDLALLEQPEPARQS